MSVKPGDSLTLQFTTRRFDTGAITSADALPTGTLVRNGADTAEVVTVTLLATGRYTAAFTVPVGYAAGDEVELRIAATVNTVSDEAVIWRATLDGKRNADLSSEIAAGVPLADGAITSAKFAAGAINAAAIGTGAFTSAKFAAGALAAGVFGTNAITADALAADAVAEVQSGLATGAKQDTIIGFLDTEISQLLADTTTLLGRLTAARALLLDNLDAAITTRMATFVYTAPDNAGLATLLTRIPDIDLSTMADRWLGMVQLDGAVYQYTVNAMELAPAGGGGGGGGFDGSNAVTLNFRDGAAALVPGAVFTVVGVGTSVAGTGSFTGGLNPGTYTVRVSPTSGVIWADQQITVNANPQTFNIDGTADLLPAPSDPTLVVGVLDVYDGAGSLLPDEPIQFRLVVANGDAGKSYPRTPFAAHSNDAGRLAQEFLPSKDYQGRRGTGVWVDFTTPASGSFSLPAILGQQTD